MWYNIPNLLIEKGKQKNFDIIACDENEEIKPIKDAKILFIVKDSENNKLIEKRNYTLDPEEEISDEDQGIYLKTDGNDGAIRLSLSPLDTNDMEEGYYNYIISIKKGKIEYRKIKGDFIVIYQKNKNENKEENKEDSEEREDETKEDLNDEDENDDYDEDKNDDYDEDNIIHKIMKKIEKKYFLNVW